MAQKKCEIVKLKSGSEEERLYLINGINSYEDYGRWNIDTLNFPGEIHGLNWESTWEDWEIIKSGSVKDILPNLVNFVIGYLEVCKRADEAGEFLSQKIKPSDKTFIYSHSMGTRAAFHCHKNFSNNDITVFLFNGALPHSKNNFNFLNNHSGINSKVVNYYNPSDHVLNVLRGIKLTIETASALIPGLNSVVNKFGNVNKIIEFFDPIGLQHAETVHENYSMNELQGVGHGIGEVSNIMIILQNKSIKGDNYE